MPHTMFTRGFSNTLSTKRGSISGVRRGAAVDYLSDIRCAPILPLESTARQEAFVRGVSIDLQVFCDVADIIPEDIVIAEDEEWVVVEVSKYQIVGGGKACLQLALRKYQGS